MNCSFNIRYKPRTTRAFTKSDLTVYDSAGNTALNALTVYGKSEVVDGSIKSAGEGWSVVDLGTQNYTYDTTSLSFPVFRLQNLSTRKGGSTQLLSPLYQNKIGNRESIDGNMQMATWNTGSSTDIAFRNDSYNDAAAFKSAMSGVLLCYELNDPSQGNTIAVKTDNGSVIDGTMAVFSTGTPLRGIPETDVRDVMAWDGTSGEVTKVCGKVRLADCTWEYYEQYNSFVTNIPGKSNSDPNDYSKGVLCDKYSSYNAWWTDNSKPNKTISCASTNSIAIKDSDYTTVPDFVASLGDAELVYELATPTTQTLTSTENASIAALKTFEPQTHAQNNAQTEMTVDYTIKVPSI